MKQWEKNSSKLTQKVRRGENIHNSSVQYGKKVKLTTDQHPSMGLVQSRVVTTPKSQVLEVKEHLKNGGSDAGHDNDTDSDNDNNIKNIKRIHLGLIILTFPSYTFLGLPLGVYHICC